MQATSKLAWKQSPAQVEFSCSRLDFLISVLFEGLDIKDFLNPNARENPRV
jgi:hypothetical protein